MRYSGIFSIALMASALVITAAGADLKSSKKTAGAKEQPPAAGMVVAKDPDGTLRAPTAAEAAALQSSAPAARRTAPALNSVAGTTPGSGVMIVLDPATSNVYSVMKKGPDGKLRLECVNGEEAAKVAMKSVRAPSSAEALSEK